MARAATSSRTSSSRANEPPKKRLGRPVGSKNRTSAKTRSKSAPVVKRTARSSAPAPKLNKAELEAHVAKLERTVARLRKQNAELKQAAREEEAPAPEAKRKRRVASAEVAAPAPAEKRGRGAASKTRRASRQGAPEPDEAAEDMHAED